MKSAFTISTWTTGKTNTTQSYSLQSCSLWKRQRKGLLLQFIEVFWTLPSSRQQVRLGTNEPGRQLCRRPEASPNLPQEPHPIIVPSKPQPPVLVVERKTRATVENLHTAPRALGHPIWPASRRSSAWNGTSGNVYTARAPSCGTPLSAHAFHARKLSTKSNINFSPALTLSSHFRSIPTTTSLSTTQPRSP